MSNQELVDRNKIIGVEEKDYGFDRILRGYDPKQVNEYINNIVQTNKQASTIFDQRLADSRNETEMLKYELQQAKVSLTEVKHLFNEVSAQRDALKNEQQKVNDSVSINDEELQTLQEKINTLSTQNRLLREENKKLDEAKTNLQRDVAHLTKKVDKNRFEIKNLRDQTELGVTDDTAKLNAQLAQIYESAIDKAEDFIFRMQTEFSLTRSKAEDVKNEL